MPSNSIMRLPRGHRFRPKFDFTVMAPNHSGDSLGSILGSIGPHWVQKWVTTVKNYHTPKFDFSTTPRSSISTKIRLYGNGAKSRWGPPRVHFVANGVPLGPKMGHHRKKNYHAPKFEFSTTPWSSISTKFDFTVMARNHSGSILGPMGSHWVQKMGQHRKKLLYPQIRIFNYPAVFNFDQNSTLRLWRKITV